MYVCMYVCVWICVYVCVYIYIYIYMAQVDTPPPPPHPAPPAGLWLGPRTSPPYFWVEKFKKSGIRVIGDGGGPL